MASLEAPPNQSNLACFESLLTFHPINNKMKMSFVLILRSFYEQITCTNINSDNSPQVYPAELAKSILSSDNPPKHHDQNVFCTIFTINCLKYLKNTIKLLQFRYMYLFLLNSDNQQENKHLYFIEGK